MFEFFTENEAILTINQGSNQGTLGSTLDDGVETRGVVLDISKALGKFWHECLLYKLKQNGL